MRNIISRDLISVPITIHSVSVCAPGSYLLKQKWAWEPPWVHSLALILALPQSPGRVQEEGSSLKEEVKAHFCIYSPPCLNQRTVQWLPLSLIAYESWGIPTFTWHRYLWNLLKSGHDFPEKEKSFFSCSVHLHHSQHSWIRKQCLSSICSTISLTGKRQTKSFQTVQIGPIP